jgi:hypothetical protein
VGKATEDRILDFAFDLMQTVEDATCKEWDSPPAGAAYLAAKKAFQASIEQRIRSNEWVKE